MVIVIADMARLCGTSLIPTEDKIFISDPNYLELFKLIGIQEYLPNTD